MQRIHVDIMAAQTPKKSGDPCGDCYLSRRTAEETLLIVCDGIGSGVRANLAAVMTMARLERLMSSGFSLRNAFMRVAEYMEAQRLRDDVYPYAVFAVLRILPDGSATVMNYEFPPAILVGGLAASVVEYQPIPVGGAVAGESHLRLGPGEGVLLMSDGITQAGLGGEYLQGWGSDGACAYLRELLRRHVEFGEIAASVHARARKIWDTTGGDDCTAVFAGCLKAGSVTIFTGPPASRKIDEDAVKFFMGSDGAKVICGGTTASIVARCLGRKLDVDINDADGIAPPAYSLRGMELVTEGAVTLNQVCNIFDDDLDGHDAQSPVCRLAKLLRSADRVVMIQGMGENPANSGNTSMKRQGILLRKNVLPLLAQKLIAAGKLVEQKFF